MWIKNALAAPITPSRMGTVQRSPPYARRLMVSMPCGIRVILWCLGPVYWWSTRYLSIGIASENPALKRQIGKLKKLEIKNNVTLLSTIKIENRTYSSYPDYYFTPESAQMKAASHVLKDTTPNIGSMDIISWRLNETFSNKFFRSLRNTSTAFGPVP